uniref:Uncharacterized protein n=1 Tax=Mycena chlorophos TaxID=658473 RepID=A0ABQ0MCR4_MYCCL|nr:predicted protein [Mycena chlorophos]
MRWRGNPNITAITRRQRDEVIRLTRIRALPPAMVAIPLHVSRIVSLFFAWALALVSLAAGINAFVKQNEEKERVSKELPSGTQLTLGADDLLAAGAVVAAVSALIMVISFVFLIVIVLDGAGKTRSSLSTRTLPMQFGSLAFLAVWLFATEVAVTDFVATRSVKVSATLDGIPVPDSIIRLIERALDEKTAYKDFGFLKLLAILPWFAFLSTAVAAVVAFIALRRQGTEIRLDYFDSARTSCFFEVGSISSCAHSKQAVPSRVWMGSADRLNINIMATALIRGSRLDFSQCRPLKPTHMIDGRLENLRVDDGSRGVWFCSRCEWYMGLESQWEPASVANALSGGRPSTAQEANPMFRMAERWYRPPSEVFVAYQSQMELEEQQRRLES